MSRPDVTADLGVWQEMGLEVIEKLNQLPGICNDELEQQMAVMDLDQLVAEHFEYTPVVITSPELQLMDEDDELIFCGAAQVGGLFLGARTFSDGDDVLYMGCFTRVEFVDVLDDEFEGTIEGAVFALADLATTTLWSPVDLMFGNAHDQLPLDPTASGEETERIEDIEHRLDAALLNGTIDFIELTTLFTEPGIMYSETEIVYFIDRLNAIFDTSSYIFTGEATAVLEQKIQNESYTIHTKRESEEDTVPFVFTDGCKFQAGKSQEGGVILLLTSVIRDEEGFAICHRAVDIDSVVSIRCINIQQD